MLDRHGYGVLVYDPRGSGNSEGTVNSYGWGWEKDAAAALDFLARRDDVRPGGVGVLGLSTGADMAIDIAARRHDVHAVVADGAARHRLRGHQGVHRRPAPARQAALLMFKTIELIQGRSGPKASLADQIARSRAPHLLVSAGKLEKEWGELYDRAGGAHSAALVPAARAPHRRAAAVPARPTSRRVVSFKRNPR